MDDSRAPAARPLEGAVLTDNPASTVRRTAANHEGLARTIEEQIVPRLVMAHQPPALEAVGCEPNQVPPGAEEVATLAALAADQRLADALAFVEAQCVDGHALETILLHLISPAAQLLGAQWLEDERSFGEVTLGLGTLQRVVQILGPRIEAPMFHRGLVVLVAAPREQHTLGIFVLGELLRQRGWGVHVEPNMSETDLLALVSTEPVVALGISASGVEHTSPLPRLVARAMKASLKPDLQVLLGGHEDLEPIAERIGATFCDTPDDALTHLANWAPPGSLRAVSSS